VRFGPLLAKVLAGLSCLSWGDEDVLLFVEGTLEPGRLFDRGRVQLANGEAGGIRNNPATAPRSAPRVAPFCGAEIKSVARPN
jgi:hypothetical protein